MNKTGASVSSKYHNEGCLENAQINWESTVWNGKFSSKIKIFLWKVLRKALPIGSTLQSRGISTMAHCVQCGELETTSHLFLHCELAREESLGIGPFQVYHRLEIHTRLPHRSKRCKKVDLSTSNRNSSGTSISMHLLDNLDNKKPKNLSEPILLVNKAIRDAKEWLSAQISATKDSAIFLEIQSESINPNQIICQSDASWIEQDKTAGMGWVFLTCDKLEIRRGCSSETFVISPLTAEALAIRAAMKHALELGFTSLQIQSDSQDLIRAINRNEQLKEIIGIIFDIKAMSSCFLCIKQGFEFFF